jgi:hypothetical protein
VGDAQVEPLAPRLWQQLGLAVAGEVVEHHLLGIEELVEAGAASTSMSRLATAPVAPATMATRWVSGAGIWSAADIALVSHCVELQ